MAYINFVGTYSFDEIALTLKHKQLGTITTDGQGVGEITFSFNNARTLPDVASDGTTVFSKIRDRLATVTVTVLQGSPLHDDLQRWFNYLETTSANRWATTTGVLKSTPTGEEATLNGVAFERPADRAYGARAQYMTWTLLVADASFDTI